MSQKPFDHIENKIREAAADSEPAFDEAAWQHMEILLNKEERKKRPLFIWWRMGLLILILGMGVTGYWYFNDRPVAKNEVISRDKPVRLSVVNKNENAITGSATESADLRAEATKKSDIDLQILSLSKPAVSAVSQKNNGLQKTFIKQINLPDANTKASPKITSQKKAKVSMQINGGIVEEINNTVVIDEEKNSSVQQVEVSQTTAPVRVSPAATATSLKAATAKKTVADVEKVKVSDDKKSTKKTENKSTAPQHVSKFYLLAAAGAEASGVQLLSFNNSTVSPRYGVGFGYQFNKKLSVQTGFYAGRKKYIAGPEDYHPKTGSYWDLVKINQVKASCLVYDIPLALRYNFIQKNKAVYYTTVGLSSFIMKQEDYVYYYWAYNTYHEKAKSYTGNQHLFSILSIAAGVEKKITAQFSLMAEPYITLPLAGVGDGSVKLFSAGLQVGMKYNLPFKK